jgi:transmembrane sensor
MFFKNINSSYMNDFTNFTREDFLADDSFVNYLLDKNSGDVQFWKKWIEENNHAEVDEARLLFFAIRDSRDTAAFVPAETGEIAREYAKLQTLLKHNEAQTRVVEMRDNKVGFRKILLYAGSIAAVLLLAFSVWMFIGKPGRETQTSYVLFASTENGSKEVSLPDGSKVQLNNNSALKISSDYNSNKREVLLNGSAFFEVHKDASRPFVVTAGSVKTTALGTAFYVHGLNNNATSVSLLEGKVRVDENGNFVELTPGEKAAYTMGRGIAKSSFNTKQFLLWRQGEVGFEHAHWDEIKSFIEEYFNKEVVVKGAIPKFNFTGNFDAKRIETLLDVLAFTYNADYRLDGQKVIIAFKN